MSSQKVLSGRNHTNILSQNVNAPSSVLRYAEEAAMALNIDMATLKQAHVILNHSELPDASPRVTGAAAVYLAGQITEEYLTQVELANEIDISEDHIGSASAYLLGFDENRQFRSETEHETVMQQYLQSFAVEHGFPEVLVEFATQLIDSHEVLHHRWHQPRIIAAATLYTAARFMGITLPDVNYYYTDSSDRDLPYHISGAHVSEELCDGRPCSATLNSRCNSFVERVDVAECHRDCAEIMYSALHRDEFNAGLQRPQKALTNAFRHIWNMPREELYNVPGGLLAVSLFSKWSANKASIENALQTGDVPVSVGILNKVTEYNSATSYSPATAD